MRIVSFLYNSSSGLGKESDNEKKGEVAEALGSATACCDVQQQSQLSWAQTLRHRKTSIYTKSVSISTPDIEIAGCLEIDQSRQFEFHGSEQSLERVTEGPYIVNGFPTGPAAAFFLEFVESVVPLDVSRNGMEISAKFYEMHLLVTRVKELEKAFHNTDSKPKTPYSPLSSYAVTFHMVPWLLVHSLFTTLTSRLAIR
ncbi:hypothetical protein JEQ12_018379 [Ovis aries]|uniref:Uncharacterized protein n=1 Tax=Ovis aries TaxID=9940 RepID=A0A836A623_SHEEP|nr:hypothetical protein JEQ12_018379 [Ovis aries]